MQINRLFEIVYILLEKKLVTANELSKQFEVSVRTIYRDIETLSSAGIPVYMTKGKGGGISLLPDFVLNKAVITEDEKGDILSSLKAVQSVDLSHTNTALRKLSSLLGDSSADWIEVEFSPWSDADKETELFNQIKNAILKKWVISFVYASARETQTKREVEPCKLIFKSGAWYLYGYCRLRKDFRFFKLRRIRELNVSEEYFERKRSGPVLSTESQYETEYVTLKLHLSAKAAYRVYEEFEIYEELEDGSFLAEMKYPKGEWIYYYIATFGNYCEVLEPVEVREQIQKQLKKTLMLYE